MVHVDRRMNAADVHRCIGSPKFISPPLLSIHLRKFGHGKHLDLDSTYIAQSHHSSSSQHSTSCEDRHIERYTTSSRAYEIFLPFINSHSLFDSTAIKMAYRGVFALAALSTGAFARESIMKCHSRRSRFAHTNASQRPSLPALQPKQWPVSLEMHPQAPAPRQLLPRR